MSLFTIGNSGIQAARIGMNATAMNIANVNTPGYSRQRAEQSSIGPMGNQRLFSGSGVAVDGIRRMADQFRTEQVWRGTTEQSYYAQGQSYLGALEKMIGSDATGLGDGLDNLFKALSGATEKPENQAMRQDLLTEAKSLAMRFNNLQKFMQRQRSDIQQQQQDIAGNINSLTGNIAQYNQKISETEAAGGDTSVLRDQRDELVKSLSEKVDIRINQNDKGEYQITLPSGQPLVSGKDVGTISIVPDASGELNMSISFGGTAFNADLASGGQLGALHDYEINTLAATEASVNGMAEAMATAFNDQLAKGFDLNGDAGKPLFVFDLSNPDGMLQVGDIAWDELAFSSDPLAQGNNENLLALIKIKTETYAIPGVGNSSLDNASASLISTIGIQSRQNQTELSAATSLLQEAIAQRDSYSAVDYDEEYVNLTSYTQAYQANMKVIATGDQIFSDLLALF